LIIDYVSTVPYSTTHTSALQRNHTHAFHPGKVLLPPLTSPGPSIDDSARGPDTDGNGNGVVAAAKSSRVQLAYTAHTFADDVIAPVVSARRLLDVVEFKPAQCMQQCNCVDYPYTPVCGSDNINYMSACQYVVQTTFVFK
jgi:hypothetical protein